MPQQKAPSKLRILHQNPQALPLSKFSLEIKTDKSLYQA